MKRGIVGVGAAAMLILGTPVAAHAEDAPPVDPPTTAPPPVVLPPIPSDPIVLPPPETPTGVFIPPPPTDGGQQAEPPSAVFVPPPLVLTEAQTLALVATANSGSKQWDIQFDDNGTLQMRPFGSSEPWMQVGPTGTKRLSAPPPGTVKIMWDVDALFADHQLKRLDPIGKKLSNP